MKKAIIIIINILVGIISASGALCGLITLFTSSVVTIVSAVIFLPVWGWLVYSYYKDSTSKEIYQIIEERLLNKN